jgi:hypothetical protein
MYLDFQRDLLFDFMDVQIRIPVASSVDLRDDLPPCASYWEICPNLCKALSGILFFGG